MTMRVPRSGITPRRDRDHDSREKGTIADVNVKRSVVNVKIVVVKPIKLIIRAEFFAR